MRALIPSILEDGMLQARSSSTPARAPGRARQLLQLAINVVFGAPFAWCVVVAIRGPMWWSSHRLFDGALGGFSGLLWSMAAALGALWLGVTLLLSPVPIRKFAGALLILVGVAVPVLLMRP